MNANKLNIHASVSDREFRSVCAEARRLGITPKFERDGETILFATMPVTLFLNSRESAYSKVSIHDRTYSRTLLHVEQLREEK